VDVTLDIEVVGAGGHLGRRVTDALTRAGVGFRDVDQPAGRGVVVAALAPGDRLDGVTEAVVSGGGVLLDAAVGQRRVRQLLALDDRARRAGATLVPAAGWAFAVGDLLVGRAAAGRSDLCAAHVAYYVPGWAGLAGRASPGFRREVLDAVAEPGVALVAGEEATEHVGEARRLAWFPRPVGPHHAAGIPGAEALLVPRHVPGIATVRTYVALRSSVAELAQGLGALARWSPVAGWLSRQAGRGTAPRTDERWAVVAEVTDAAGDLVRAWAYGHDRLGVAGAILATLAGLVRDPGAPPGAPPRVPARVLAGVRAPSELAPPAEILDELAATTDLRWSVTT
jgi:hypothetical protein